MEVEKTPETFVANYETKQLLAVFYCSDFLRLKYVWNYTGSYNSFTCSQFLHCFNK